MRVVVALGSLYSMLEISSIARQNKTLSNQDRTGNTHFDDGSSPWRQGRDEK
jgi:hypothetical protein